MRKILLPAALLLALALVLTACGGSATAAKEVHSDVLYVKQVEDLPDDFILGMDASSVIAEEDSGVKFYNFEGEEQDVFQTLAENGIDLDPIEGTDYYRFCGDDDMSAYTEQGVTTLVVDPSEGCDTGTPAAWAATNARMALADPAFAPAFREEFGERGMGLLG